jgi:hypothetical protein
LAYSSTLKIKAACSSETSVDLERIVSLANTILVTLYTKTLADGDETVKCAHDFIHISPSYKYRNRPVGSRDSEILYTIEKIK